ncbi:MAG: four helix bundle protein [Phycisphaerae bacterium]|nr:four helix bundle protein [Phycisphaerae bacterium]
MAKRRVASYEELDVYKLAVELQQRVFDVSRAWPAEERYSLTDQIRRAARSIGGNIAESWAKRRYPAHFVSKLSDADGEQNETRHWLRTALACGYLKAGEHAELDAMCKRVGAMLGRMMVDTESWSDGPTV